MDANASSNAALSLVGSPRATKPTSTPSNDRPAARPRSTHAAPIPGNNRQSPAEPRPRLRSGTGQAVRSLPGASASGVSCTVINELPHAARAARPPSFGHPRTPWLMRIVPGQREDERRERSVAVDGRLDAERDGVLREPSLGVRDRDPAHGRRRRRSDVPGLRTIRCAERAESGDRYGDHDDGHRDADPRRQPLATPGASDQLRGGDAGAPMSPSRRRNISRRSSLRSFIARYLRSVHGGSPSRGRRAGSARRGSNGGSRRTAVPRGLRRTGGRSRRAGAPATCATPARARRGGGVAGLRRRSMAQRRGVPTYARSSFARRSCDVERFTIVRRR